MVALLRKLVRRLREFYLGGRTSGRSCKSVRFDPAIRREVFGLTWSIPHDFGGMTSVMLERSVAFGEFSGRSVEILTLSPDSNPDADAARLQSIGKLGPKVSIRNLWTELRSTDDAGLERWFGRRHDVQEFSRAVPGDWAIQSEDPTKTVYVTPAGSTQTRYLRPDGSVVAIDDRTGQQRALVILDSTSVPWKSFHRIRDFYFSWFDFVVGPGRAVIINESKTVGAFFHSYKRSNVLTAQVLHNAHLEAAAPSVYGPYSASRRGMIVNHERFDIFAFLTDQQKIDFESAFGKGANHVVLPNSRTFDPESILPDRAPGAGLVLASLDERKRVADAVSAVAEVMVDGTHKITLDIYGRGPLEESLQALIASSELDKHVKLRGYTNRTADVIRDHSFLLLTSRAEGMGLVLVEAMAQGCIPIAYDVRYGPSDIIEDGVNGFLVPNGDVSALANTIRSFLELPQEDLLRLRTAARRRATDFLPEAIIQRWEDTIVRAEELHGTKKHKRIVLTDSSLERSLDGSYNVSFALEVHDDSNPRGPFVVDAATEDLRYAFCESATAHSEDHRVIGQARLPLKKFVAPAGTQYKVYVREEGAALYTRAEVGTVSLP